LIDAVRRLENLRAQAGSLLGSRLEGWERQIGIECPRCANESVAPSSINKE